MQRIFIDPTHDQSPTRDLPASIIPPNILPPSKAIQSHPTTDGGIDNASIYYVGAATVIIEWTGIRILTDPNFIHAGTYAQFGGGVSSERRTNPAVELHDLPRIDLILLSHFHGDHFDQKVESCLRRDVPIIANPHAQAQLTARDQDPFTNVSALRPWETALIEIGGTGGTKRPLLRVTGTPAQHVSSNAVVELLNKWAQAIPPTNGWILELGTSANSHDMTDFNAGYRIYITGDTLMNESLHSIHQRWNPKHEPINLMLAHLGGTMIPSPAVSPFAFQVSMDAGQAVRLIKLIEPEVTIPLHYEDYVNQASSLAEFTEQVKLAGLDGKVVILERRESFQFRVREPVGRVRMEDVYFGGGRDIGI
ncbi:Uncharacterized protein PECH_006109 [Penicillium ucsense]|uniref:Metallo-beta-lactamase domain-containing protein n=1 Tax=Penicillium ucsense TaxID=2839758 RepID=A0A8J8W1L5_9EURO|nr:Uncharacterized protein PECM_008193 [Penicillium ucsense]KAF7735859.1 Uncharacterized protein PECH_006109 [Penicillium ucsense]